MTTQPVEFTRANNTTTGNPRIVCHFLRFINEGDEIKAATKGMGFVSEEYRIALNKARKLHGKKYHNKKYGGGIVFESHDPQKLSDKIRAAQKVNGNFLKDWTPKQFKQMEKAILNHFQQYTYKHQATHDPATLKPFRPFTFNEIDEKLGIAYTSTGAYAGYWICNGGYLMANETHHFTGFAINTEGQFIAIVEDENENAILIEM